MRFSIMAVSMLERLTSAVRRIRNADAFDAGAQEMLPPMLERVRAALDEHGVTGRTLRGVAVLRDDDRYAAIAVIEDDGARARVEEQLTSSNVWRWIAKHERPVAVDVLFGHAGLLDRPDLALSTATHPGTAFEVGPSREMMMARGTTHLLVFPLADERGQLRGMVSLEVQARGETRMDAVWRSCAAELTSWVELTGPSLCALEVRAQEAGVDPLLPVCGEEMAKVVRLVRVFAAQTETLLLSGPTGVGKSRMALFCHARSPRADGPFETVDLLSVPATMQAAELYGWKKGAFTSADRDHEGYLGRAEGGSLFLDEIDKLSLDSQASLLRLLETRRYRPLGSAVDREADVRFLVGTNADLLAEVREGRFREDLYYRIQVLAVRIPPLSQRTDEIGPWAAHLLRSRSEEAGRTARLSEPAQALLQRARWPGNLRQLDNAVRRAFVLATADATGDTVVVDAPHVEASLATETSGATSAIAASLDDAARRAVEAAQRGATLDLEDAVIFRAHVLGAAIMATGDVEAALRLLGRENLVKNRNHHKTVDRELERVRGFYAALGETAPAWLIAALSR
ncbi:MAG: sigma-54-dependent transcriptional regulator [Sandaracinaceae bacterium]